MFDNISVPGAVAIAILVVLVLIVIVRNIYIVQQSKAYVCLLYTSPSPRDRG